MARNEQLPPDLPVPVDDGLADHLPGARMPSVPLPATGGGLVDLSTLAGRTAVFVYPRTAPPDEPEVELAAWSAIPGARGCTPQACGYRDHFAEFQRAGVRVHGLSVQETDPQREVVARLALPFELLPDADLELTSALRLPTMEYRGRPLLKRLTLVIRDGTIEHVLYPVFPPDQSAAAALQRLA
jgi:peroxiredoxin